MFLDLCASVLIPVYTLFFAKGYGWFSTNFSVIGNMFRRKEVFVLWAVLVGLYFFFSLRQIIRKMPGKVKGSFLVPVAVVLLLFAITTPYLPQEFPLKAVLHIVFAMLASACLVIVTAYLFWQMKPYAPERANKYLRFLGLIVAGSIVLFFVSGIISSAMEIFFVLGMVALMERVRRYPDWEQETEEGKSGGCPQSHEMT